MANRFVPPRTDAERELAAFNHYQEVKNKIGSVFKQLAAPSVPQ